MQGLRAYFDRHQIKADWDAIGSVPGERLVTLDRDGVPVRAERKAGAARGA